MVEEKKSEGLGISGFTLGIMGILFLGYGGLIISIVGGIFCFIQQKRHKTGLGKIGLIINIIGVVLSLIYIIFIAPLLAQYLGSLNNSFPTA